MLPTYLARTLWRVIPGLEQFTYIAGGVQQGVPLPGVPTYNLNRVKRLKTYEDELNTANVLLSNTVVMFWLWASDLDYNNVPAPPRISFTLQDSSGVLYFMERVDYDLTRALWEVHARKYVTSAG
jgi:hypothetical protein